MPKPTTKPKPANIEVSEKDLLNCSREDRSTAHLIRAHFDKNPHLEKTYGDFAGIVMDVWITKITGEIVEFREGLVRRINRLRTELGGPAATPLERLLVERILMCWLQVHRADYEMAAHREASVESGTYYQRQVDRAQRRYLQAVSALAQVRRLLIPALQVNIGRNQVNVGAIAAPPPSSNTSAASTTGALVSTSARDGLTVSSK